MKKGVQGMNIEPDAIVTRLVSEFGFSEQGAQIALQKVSTSHPAVQEAFEKWWRGEGLDEQLQVQGVTLKRMVERAGGNPMYAFITMADMLREPPLEVQIPLPSTIMNIETSAIVARLVSDGYTEREARRAVQSLSTSHLAVQKAFEKWWRGGELDEQLQVRGYTVKRLVERRGFKPTGAFSTMDSLLHEPEAAVKALRTPIIDNLAAFENEKASDGQEQKGAPKEEATDAERTRAETEAMIAIVEAWAKEGLIQRSQAESLLKMLITVWQRLSKDPDFDVTHVIERMPQEERKILGEAAEEAILEYHYFLPERKKR
jgi:hypothetical protein